MRPFIRSIARRRMSSSIAPPARKRLAGVLNAIYHGAWSCLARLSWRTMLLRRSGVLAVMNSASLLAETWMLMMVPPSRNERLSIYVA